MEEALLSGFTPEQRQLYDALEEVRARRDLRERESVFRAGVLLGAGLVAEILGRTDSGSNHRNPQRKDNPSAGEYANIYYLL